MREAPGVHDTRSVPSRPSGAPIGVIGVSSSRELAPGGTAHSRSRYISEADMVVGARRYLDAVEGLLHARARTVCVGSGGLPLEEALDVVASEPGRVCILASGDPGFFGILRVLAERFGRDALDVHPAPSSAAVAFARLGIPWDDAAVISVHGRDVSKGCALACRYTKVALLTDPAVPLDELSASLVASGARFTSAAVCSSLGEVDESVQETTLLALVKGHESRPGADASIAPTVLLLWNAQGVSRSPALGFPPSPRRVEWGLPGDFYVEGGGMVTKGEVRAVVLSRLALSPAAVLWDIGAGTGSVGIEAASFFPSLRVVAVERDAEACARIEKNATAAAVSVEVIHGEAPGTLPAGELPASVFVGGGGLPVLTGVLQRVEAGTRVVATFSALDRAVQGHQLLGNLVEMSVSRGSSLPDGGLRLAAENPVFVVWGDSE